MRNFFRALVVPALALCLSAGASAQDWPQKNVRIVVGYGAGSVPDSMARVVFDQVAKITGKAMVIDNRPGAGGMIGMDLVAKAAPDGYTLGVASSGPLNVNSLLYKKMPYDPQHDLTPVALMADTGTILVVNNNVKARNAQELLAEMARPGSKMAYGSPGNGQQGHVSMAYLVNKAGADVPHIAYPGTPQIVSALISGDVQMAALAPLAAVGQVKAGKMRALGVIGPSRHHLLPDLPTLKEQGIDLDIAGWAGVVAPAKTPPAIVERINALIVQALKVPEVAENFRNTQGMIPSDKTPAQFATYLADEYKAWGPVIKKNNIVLE